MSQAEQSIITQVWWDGSTVDFVRWTEKSLVFCWEGARKTAVHMPRGAVVRLLDKGVLRIEGYQPEWLAPREACDSDLPPERVPPPAENRPGSRRNAILRLIRKLSGSGEREPASATG